MTRSPLTIGVALLLIALGCTADVTSDPPVTAPQDVPVTIQELDFSSADIRDQFEALQDCICDRTEGWSHHTLSKSPSNDVREYWCSNIDLELDECRRLASTSRLIDGWYELRTSTFELPNVQGIGFQAFSPLEDGPQDVRYGVSISVSDELISQGSASSAVLVSWPAQSTDRRRDQEVVATISTGPAYEIRIDGSTDFLYLERQRVQAIAGEPWELLDEVRQSPEATAAAIREQWSLLAASVETALVEDQLSKCLSESEPGENATPPTCLEWSPLSDAEKASALANFEIDRAEALALAEMFGDQLHEGIARLLPNECWPSL